MNQNRTNWATLLHISQLLGFILPIPYIGVITPLLIWQFARSRQPNLDQHGQIVVNWIISSTLYFIIAFISIIGIIFIPILWGLTVVFPAIGAAKADRGRVWSYPLTINFIGGNISKQKLFATSLGLLMLALPAIFGLVGTGLWANQRSNWIDQAMTTQGSVVELKEETDRDGDTMYRPVIEFRDRAGDTHQFSPKISSNPPSYEEGESVKIVYPPESPEDAILNNWISKWGGVTLVGTIVLIILGFALIPSITCFILSVMRN